MRKKQPEISNEKKVTRTATRKKLLEQQQEIATAMRSHTNRYMALLGDCNDFKGSLWPAE